MSEDKEKKSDKPSSKDQADFPTLSQIGSVEEIGTQIGPYKLLSVLGEGGFGIVYLAEQKSPIRRQVALKVIKPGMDSKQVLARFESERQALALLDHPNIAHVFDGGTTESGRPYFVMELVKGLKITEYCDQQKLKIEERLKLFQQVCDAVQHAHQKGIIHRDIKPSNILVSVHEGKPIPMIIDFGVAKAISQPLTERTLYTEQGQFIGTPEYMSPEQAGISIEGIDTRSDIYSLGVVLYELLTGTLPFTREELGRAGRAEIQRVIRESEPPRPSTRLSSMGEEAIKIADRRSTQIAVLTKRIKKELEWIPLKAMRKEPGRRYRSASELADDVKNYLDGNPLIAGPESVTYRLKKGIKRHRALAVGVCAVLIVLIAGIIVSTHFAVEAVEQTRKAEKTAEETRRSLYANKIALIHSEYKSANTANVKRLLEECPEDLRNWEYDYLKKISDQSLTTIKGHERRVDRIMFTPDGSKIISASYSDKTIKVWDVVTGEELKVITLDPDVRISEIAPNGEYFATYGSDNIIKLWDINNNKLLKTFKGHNHSICSVLRFNNKGNRIASADRGSKKDDPMIKIWDVNTGKEVISIQHPGVQISYLDFSPDSQRLATKSYFSGAPTYHYEFRTWDLRTGEMIKEVPVSYYKKFGVVHFHGVQYDITGRRILTPAWGQAWVWDAESLEIETAVPIAHNYGSRRGTFSPSGKNFLTGGVFGPLKLWNSMNGKLIRTLHGHTETIMSMAYSSDGVSIVSGDSSGTIKLWNPIVDHEKYEIETIPHQQIRSLSLNSEGTIMAAGTPGSYIRLMDTNQWKTICGLSGHSGTTKDVSFSPDGTRLVSGNEDMSIRIWDVESESPHNLVLKGHSDSVNSVQFSPCGKYIASGSSDGTIKIWNSDTGNLINTFNGHDSSINAIQYTSDGKQIISGSEDFTVKLWEVETGKCLNTFVGHENGITCVALAHNNRIFFSGDKSGIGIEWGKDIGKEFKIFKGHLKGIKSVCYSKDDKRLFSSSEDGTIRVWDTETGRSLLTLENYSSGGIWGLVLSSDGNTMYSIPIWRSTKMLIYSTNTFEEYAEIITKRYRLENEPYFAINELKRNPLKIPSLAKSFNNHHYLLYLEPMNWKEAKAFAETVGGHLATITSKEENEWTTVTFPYSYWLGGTDEEEEGNWKWITGEKWQFTEWSRDEPDNYLGSQDSLEVLNNGKWNDLQGEEVHPFLIEWDR